MHSLLCYVHVFVHTALSPLYALSIAAPCICQSGGQHKFQAPLGSQFLKAALIYAKCQQRASPAAGDCWGVLKFQLWSLHWQLGGDGVGATTSALHHPRISLQYKDPPVAKSTCLRLVLQFQIGRKPLLHISGI